MNARVSRMHMVVSCQMLTPPTVTASDSGFSRAPLHARHGTSRMNCSMRSLAVSDSACEWRRSTFGTTPSYVVQYDRTRPYRLRYRTWTSSSEPYRTISWAHFGSFFQGTESLNPCASATPWSRRSQYSSRELPHGAMAPSSMDRSGSGTTSSGSTWRYVPSPSQVVHAPYGELNEKFRGASSSNDSPSNVQASDWEKLMTSSVPSVCTAMAAIPSVSWSAVSTESATRLRMSGFATRRSTTTSMECL